jgi:(2Fe-2S) ferredoxin
MQKSPLPYKQLIFVCTNARKPGERISCAGEGRCGQQILDRLKEYVKKNNLQDSVRVAKSGCQEKCELGPNVAVLPQNDFLSGVQVGDVEKIIKTYLEVSPPLVGGD